VPPDKDPTIIVWKERRKGGKKEGTEGRTVRREGKEGRYGGKARKDGTEGRQGRKEGRKDGRAERRVKGR
jgi:hypothetical protein